jgi:hypothetical protein
VSGMAATEARVAVQYASAIRQNTSMVHSAGWQRSLQDQHPRAKHPDTDQSCTWPDGDPWTVPAAELITLTEASAHAWFAGVTDLLTARGWRRNKDDATLAAAAAGYVGGGMLTAAQALACAIWYAKHRGWYVFPVHLGLNDGYCEKVPCNSGERTNGRNWGIANDPDEARALFHRFRSVIQCRPCAPGEPGRGPTSSVRTRRLLIVLTRKGA